MKENKIFSFHYNNKKYQAVLVVQYDMHIQYYKPRITFSVTVDFSFLGFATATTR